MNWIDLVILAVVGYYAIRGYNQGIIAIIIELAGYVISYFIAIRFSYIGTNLIVKYIPVSLPKSYEDTIGLAITWTLAMFVYYLLAPFIIRFIPPFITHSLVNKVGGVVGSALKGFILLSVILFVVQILPISQEFRNDLNDSVLAKPILATNKEFQSTYGTDLSNSVKDTISQISLIPNSVSTQNTEKLINLGYTLTNTTTNPKDEETMFAFVNQQRVQHHVKPLTINNTLVQVARIYGVYMFSNGFFSHITPSGQSPFDRVKNSNVKFTYVGENIAKAPDVNAADTGFMNSPEHKANILDPNYTQIGIGVTDGGPQYGKMYVQDFIGTN